ncbi:MAG TPA: 50S ribosomal protein L17 [Candidatus Paceibacterota bacterium]
MAYQRAHRKFGREKNQRVALLKSLAYALATKEKIRTTEAKAKELRPYMEKLITLGKKETLASRRLLESRVGSGAARKIALDLSSRYKERAGGYTRITKLMLRKSDNSKMAVIELV